MLPTMVSGTTESFPHLSIVKSPVQLRRGGADCLPVFEPRAEKPTLRTAVVVHSCASGGLQPLSFQPARKLFVFQIIVPE